jgi:transketolase
MIACKTIIGYGAPTKADSHASHGSALGEKEIAGARKALGWPYAPFEIPDDVYADWHAAAEVVGARAGWEARLAAVDASVRSEFERRMKGDLPAGLDAAVNAYKQNLSETKPKVATRKSSEMALDMLATVVPELAGGSADLTGSNLTNAKIQHPADAGRLFGPLHPLRHPRIRHGGGDERHRAARRLHPLWRHVHGLLGLLPSGHPPVGADGRARHLRHDA